MTTSKDVPKLPNSSGTAPTPTNPPTFEQKSNPCLSANPSPAYPTAQSVCFHRQCSAFLSSADLIVICGNAQPVASSQTQLQWPRQNISTYPTSGGSPDGNTSSASYNGHWSLRFLGHNAFHLRGWNPWGAWCECIRYYLVFECRVMYLFSEGIECSCWDRWRSVCNIQISLHTFQRSCPFSTFKKPVHAEIPAISRCLKDTLISISLLRLYLIPTMQTSNTYESNQAKIIHSPKTNLLFCCPLRQQRTSLLRNSLSGNTLSLPILSLLPNSPRNTHPQQTSLQHPRTQIRKPRRPICPRSNCNTICKQKGPRRLNTHHWNG